MSHSFDWRCDTCERRNQHDFPATLGGGPTRDDEGASIALDGEPSGEEAVAGTAVAGGGVGRESEKTLECASCHRTIDPIGFALENFDAVGRWRDYADGAPVDVLGGLPDGSEFDGVAGLEAGLLRRPELFVETLTEKLLTFALGRGVAYYDAPAVRRILREAEPDGYRFQSLILGIVSSVPFQMRNSL